MNMECYFKGKSLKVFKSEVEIDRKRYIACASICDISYTSSFKAIATKDGSFQNEKDKSVEIRIDHWSEYYELRVLCSNPLDKALFSLFIEVEVNNKLWSGIVKMENQMFFISNGIWDIPSDYGI